MNQKMKMNKKASKRRFLCQKIKSPIRKKKLKKFSQKITKNDALDIFKINIILF